MKMRLNNFSKTKTILVWGASAALVLVILLIGLVYILPGYDMSFVKSGSMEPAINTGDMVVTVPVDNILVGSLKPGQVITFSTGSSAVTHRIVSKQGEVYVTKGDANEQPDTQTVDIKQIKGIVWFHIPKIGYLVGFIRTKPGFLLSIILPTFILIALIVVEILKETFKSDRKQEVVKTKEQKRTNKQNLFDNKKPSKEMRDLVLEVIKQAENKGI